MEGKKRRERIVELIRGSRTPISGRELAQKLSVSRQVIVQDIALLRAENIDIVSTTRGYLVYPEQGQCQRKFYVRHDDEHMEDELLTIIDQGGRVKDVTVKHPAYGEIKAELSLRTRQDVYDFIDKVKKKEMIPLNKLTNEFHYHTVEADTEEILDKIGHELRFKNYLLEN